MSNMRKLILILTAAAVLMFGFGFALVPLYNVFCKITGLNGKTNDTAVQNTSASIDKNRVVTVQFTATNNANLPWEFRPNVTTLKVHPGETTRIAYYAKNNAAVPMTVQAIPSVTPSQAAQYLQKTECFCFAQQTFKAGEAQEMPILFHLDPALPKHIKTITLGYTVFSATKVKPSQEKGKINVATR
jgi:cytochrome c oxidase assembly protein subunit 11